MRFLGLIAIALAAAVVVGGGYAERAFAHAALVRAEPAENAFLQLAPNEVILTFTEAIDSQESSIRVLDARGQPVAATASEVSSSGLTLTARLPALEPGIYNVLWTNVSTVDGHRLQGSYPFTVLNADGTLPDEVNQVGGVASDPDPPPEGDGIAVRALSLLGLVLGAGGLLLFLLLPAEASSKRRALAITVTLGGAVLLAATLLNFVLVRDTYPERSFRELIVETRAGSYWLTRLGATLVLLVAASSLRDAPRLAAWAGLTACGVYLWGYSATSHAAAGTGSGWAVPLDLAHGVTAIAWLGGVVGLAVTARMAGKSRLYAGLMPRFALVASISVFLLLATGLLSSLVQLDTFDRLWTTRYGWTLVVKLAVMLPLLGLAFYNSRWGRRALVAGTPGEPRRFIRLALAEALLGGLVLAAAATLTQTTVAKSIYERPEDRPFEQTAPAGDLDVLLQISPNRTGLNSFIVALTDDSGELVASDRVLLTFRYQDDQSVGPSTLALAPTSDGRYSGQGPYFTLEGEWRVEVDVRRPDVDDVKAFFDVRPAGSTVGIVRSGDTWDNPAPGLSWNEFAGIALLLAALGLALFKGRGPKLRGAQSWAANGATVFSFAAGVVLLFGVHGHTTEAVPTNPVFPDENSIEQGRTLYQQNCVACHGQNGVPPEGLDLDPYPLDLTVHVPQHSDGQLFNFIAFGVEGSAMPAWREEGLSDEEIWHLVNYLRTLGAVDR